MAEFEGGDWLHKDEDDGDKEKEEMVFNPTSVRDRIDVSTSTWLCIVNLAVFRVLARFIH